MAGTLPPLAASLSSASTSCLSAIALVCSGTVASRIARLITADLDAFRASANPSIRATSTGEALKVRWCVTYSTLPGARRSCPRRSPLWREAGSPPRVIASGV